MILNLSNLSYLDHSLQNRDPLYSPEYMCKCLGDCELHIQHFLHKHKDLHIFHCDKPKLYHILDQLGTHKAYILCKDYLCVQEDIGILLYAH